MYSKIRFTFRSLSNVSYPDECRTKKLLSMLKECLPIFRAIVKFCSTSHVNSIILSGCFIPNNLHLINHGICKDKQDTKCNRNEYTVLNKVSRSQKLI